MKHLAILAALLIMTILPLMGLVEVNATHLIEATDHDCTHYPDYEWTSYDEGTSVFVNAYSDVSTSYFDHQNWYFEREIAYEAYWDNLQYEDLSCLSLMDDSWSDLTTISTWSGITWRDNPSPPPSGQYFYIQNYGNWNWNNYYDYSQLIKTYVTTTWCCGYSTAYFYKPDNPQQLWYCSTSAYVSV